MSNTETQLQQAEMTNVKGYFNPNPYRVNLTISELNMTLPLNPMEFILDRNTKRKINDPIFDKYVGFKMLSPELSDRPVPVCRVPVTVPQPQMLPGHVIASGVRGADGKWRQAPPPAIATTTTAQPVAQAPSASRPAIKGMSMDEARRRGFVGKSRPVPEDYGQAETDGPSTHNNLPPIKYAVESNAPAARPGVLPKELMEEMRPEMAPLVAGLQAAAQTDPERANLNRRAAEEAVEAQQGPSGVKRFRDTVKDIKKRTQTAVKNIVAPAAPPAPPVARTVATPTPAAPPAPAKAKRVVAKPVTAAPAPAPAPAPIVAEEAQAESPLMGGRPAELPQSVMEEGQAPEEAPEQSPPTLADRADGQTYKCGGCGKDFPYKSYFIRHIMRSHKDRIAELMPAAD